MDYAKLYNLCKRISQHLEMAVIADGLAKEKLITEISVDADTLKTLLDKQD